MYLNGLRATVSLGDIGVYRFPCLLTLNFWNCSCVLSGVQRSSLRVRKHAINLLKTRGMGNWLDVIKTTWTGHFNYRTVIFILWLWPNRWRTLLFRGTEVWDHLWTCCIFERWQIDFVYLFRPLKYNFHNIKWRVFHKPTKLTNPFYNVRMWKTNYVCKGTGWEGVRGEDPNSVKI